MIRSLSVWIASTLAASACLAAEFPLEDYAPADFHRRYLSVSPRLDWQAFSSAEDMRASRRDNRSDRFDSQFMLNQGSERFSQRLLWDLSDGFGLSLADFGDANNGRSSALPADYGTYARSDHGLNVQYNAFSHGSAAWYPRGKLFLSPSGEADVMYSPNGKSRNLSWTENPILNSDSSLFSYSHSDSREDDLLYSVDARMAAGYGHIQDVTFAETGFFLLDRLSQSLGREVALDKEGMREMEAFLEARRKLRPFFDARQASLYDLESVVEFLQAKRPADSISPRAALEMADEWNYSWRHKRESGWKIEAFPFLHQRWSRWSAKTSSVDFSQILADGSPIDLDSLSDAAPASPLARSTRETSRTFSGELSFGAGVQAVYKRPWRRFFQIELTGYARFSRVSLEFGRDHRVTAQDAPAQDSSNYLAADYPFLESGWQALAAVFPNTRTMVSAYVKGDWSRKMDYLGSKDCIAAYVGPQPEQRVFEYLQTQGLESQYFLSQRLTLQCDVSALLDRRISHDEIAGAPWYYNPPAPLDETWSPQFSGYAGLTYYLF